MYGKQPGKRVHTARRVFCSGIYQPSRRPYAAGDRQIATNALPGDKPRSEPRPTRATWVGTACIAMREVPAPPHPRTSRAHDPRETIPRSRSATIRLQYDCAREKQITPFLELSMSVAVKRKNIRTYCMH